ncbi:MAG: hypothetical protein Q6353_008735, partial [Candidatus Sigynarchaeum springense]
MVSALLQIANLERMMVGGARGANVPVALGVCVRRPWTSGDDFPLDDPPGFSGHGHLVEVEKMLAEPLIDVRRVKIQCPACGKEQYVRLHVENLVMKNGVVSLVIKAACDHEFHLYLDKQFQVRGYERIDAVVSAEMLQVDQEISDFMKGEGIKERASGGFVGKLRNDFERDRYLETFIRYFRGADVADSYWIEAIGGHRPEPAKFELAKAFPQPSFPAPPTTIPASATPSSPLSEHAAGTVPIHAPATPVSTNKAVATNVKSPLKGIPPRKLTSLPAPVQEPVAAPVQEPAAAPVQEPATAPVQEPAAAPVQEPAAAPVQEPAVAPVHEVTV